MISQAIIKKYGRGEAVFIDEIECMFAQYKEAYIYRLLAREVASGEIVKFCRGVYYIPKKSIFGNVAFDDMYQGVGRDVRDARRTGTADRIRLDAAGAQDFQKRRPDPARGAGENCPFHKIALLFRKSCPL